MSSQKGVTACIVILVLVVSLVWTPGGSLESQTIAAATVDQVDANVLHALYSLDFDVAERELQNLIARDPQNPFYWNLLASALWLRIVFEQQKLSLESYSGGRLGTDDSSDAVTPEREARLRSVAGRAITSSEAILSRSPNHVEALYALGVTHGMLASFEATVKRAYFKAYREANTARDYHEQVLRIDPSYDDARLTLGTYDYALGVIPGFMRLLLGVVGIRGGNRQTGIQQLEQAAQLGKRASTDAKVILVVVYNREKQYDKALAVLNDLHSRYPRNFLLEVSKASVYERMKDWDNAIRVLQLVLSKVRSSTDGYGRFTPEPVLFKIGENNIHRGQSQQALSFFLQVVDSQNSSDELKARAHLWLGKMYDGNGKRQEALAQYNAILALNASKDLKNEASRYKRRPFQS